MAPCLGHGLPKEFRSGPRSMLETPEVSLDNQNIQSCTLSTTTLSKEKVDGHWMSPGRPRDLRTQETRND